MIKLYRRQKVRLHQRGHASRHRLQLELIVDCPSSAGRRGDDCEVGVEIISETR